MGKWEQIEGTGVEIPAAVLIQLEAAKAGEAEALYDLGLMYSTGKFVPVDYVEAHKWFNLAALKGSEAAKDERAAISDEMTANEIVEAQKLARQWLQGMG